METREVVVIGPILMAVEAKTRPASHAEILVMGKAIAASTPTKEDQTCGAVFLEWCWGKMRTVTAPANQIAKESDAKDRLLSQMGPSLYIP